MLAGGRGRETRPGLGLCFRSLASPALSSHLMDEGGVTSHPHSAGLAGGQARWRVHTALETAGSWARGEPEDTQAQNRVFLC